MLQGEQEFKVGDKVEVKRRGALSSINFGKVGRVCWVEEGVRNPSMGVVFKNWHFGHNCNGVIETTSAWCYPSSQIELTNKDITDFKEI